MPEAGAVVRIIGWVEGVGSPRGYGDAHPRLRIALDYTLQTETEAGDLVLTGPNPQAGFSGAPAVDVASGRTLGVLVLFNPGRHTEPFLPTPLQEVYVASARRLPEHLR